MSSASPRIVAVTPAGRRAYLEILKTYVLADSGITEWRLWDNCRRESDREYIHALAAQHDKITVVTLGNVDGMTNSINQFYHTLNEDDAFYIKMDDDLVYLPPNFATDLHRAAVSERDRYLYWSPIVVNNAICAWLLQHHSRVTISHKLTASANCNQGWANGEFAGNLHQAFLGAHRTGHAYEFQTPDFHVSLARFSINCIGFWGRDVVSFGERFCPIGVDDEEWISAVLPSLCGRPGRIVGSLVAAHFAFHVQEAYLLERTDVLAQYRNLAGLPAVVTPPAEGS